MTEIQNRISDSFAELKHQLNGDVNTFFSVKNRVESFNNFIKTGIPTKKHEEWKYTPLTFFNKHEFIPVIDKSKSSITYNDINELLFDNINVNLLVFINGYYSNKLSSIKRETKDSILINSIRSSVDNDDIINQDFGLITSKSDDPLVNLNNALFSDGTLIVVGDNIDVGETIHIMNICDTTHFSPLINVKNIIRVGTNSRIKIVETVHLFGEKPSVHNSTTEIETAEDSTVHYYKLQNDKGDLYNIGQTFVKQAGKSKFHSTAISLSSRFVRNTLSTEFTDEYCESNMNGFFFIDEDDFVDNHTVVDHAMPNCNSNETYRGILDNKAVGVFNGKIFVRPDAQKTTAYQSNKNILLSDEATMNTKPQLEIFADDVKCSHGATTGSLDQSSLFYLRARGVSEEKAKSLLLNAFSAEVVNKILIPELRDNIREYIGRRLGIEDIYLCYDIDKSEV